MCMHECVGGSGCVDVFPPGHLIHLKRVCVTKEDAELRDRLDLWNKHSEVTSLWDTQSTKCPSEGSEAKEQRAALNSLSGGREGQYNEIK